MFRIGDFSRLARVTIKTLHHYDEAGLLRPSQVDRHSGYRYYGAAQLQTLQRILLLKDLGFTLEQIRELLHADSATWAATLDRRRVELAESIAADRSRLRRLTALRETLDRSGVEPPVVLRDVPAVEVYSVRERVPQLGAPMQTLFERAEAVVAAAQARSPASPFTIFHDPDYREADVDVEVCIPIKPEAHGLATRLVPAVWSRIVGTAADGQYGRPFAFHQQAQRADWAAAWSKVKAPVLALYGEYDWFESHDATSLITRIVNAGSPGQGTFAEVPRMNHHFAEFPNATAAFAEQDGRVNAEPAVEAMLAWLEKIFSRDVSARVADKNAGTRPASQS